MKLPKAYETLKTEKTPDEIRSVIAKNAVKYTFFPPTKESAYDFSYKIDANMIYLSSLKKKYWPNIELELREYTEPRIKIHYAAYGLYRALYIIILITFLTANFQLSSINQLIGFSLTLIIFAIIPLIGTHLQRNFREWLLQKLKYA